MRNLSLMMLHLVIVIARLWGRGSVIAVIAENLLLKQQLIVLCRARRRAPDLTCRRPAAPRIRVAVPQSSPDSKDRHRFPSLDAARVSSGAGASPVPAAVLSDCAPEETRTER